MAGPGDIDGDVSGDEAAWRALVARLEAPAQPGAAASWPASEDVPGPAAAAPQPAAAGDTGEQATVSGHAGDPRSYSLAEEDDEPYIPEPLPPPARMDPVAKGAWVALIGGPAYLLLATLVGWTISGTEALVAIAAFIGGFVVLVVKMGDRPRRGGGDDDDGAVL